MSTTSLNGVDGYAYADIEGATRLAGPLRSARKVLPRTTIDLARHATYALAAHRIAAAAGGAAALNLDRGTEAEPADRFGDFTSAVTAWADRSGFVATTALGLSSDEATGSPLLEPTASEAAAHASAIAAAGVEGATVVVAGSSADELAERARTAGAASVRSVELEEALASGADVAIVDVATGALHHGNLGPATIGRIASVRPLATTARGLAVARRADVVIVPDFISAAGPMLTALEPDADVTARTADLLAALGGHHADLFVTAAESAEVFLRTWTDDLPFGRPLAP